MCVCVCLCSFRRRSVRGGRVTGGHYGGERHHVPGPSLRHRPPQQADVGSDPTRSAHHDSVTSFLQTPDHTALCAWTVPIGCM